MAVRRRSAAVLLVAAVTALPALAACSSDGGARAGASASPTTMTDAQLQTLADKLVQCMRTNGAPGMPDVKIKDGRAVLPDENTVDEATKRNVDSALQACKSIKDRMPPSLFEDDERGARERGEPTAKDVPKLRKFASCLRENGLPEWPDPKADGTFPLRGTPLEAEGKSQRLMTAMEACRKHWDGGIRAS
jgi:hypothetical protein